MLSIANTNFDLLDKPKLEPEFAVVRTVTG